MDDLRDMVGGLLLTIGVKMMRPETLNKVLVKAGLLSPDGTILRDNQGRRL